MSCARKKLENFTWYLVLKLKLQGQKISEVLALLHRFKKNPMIFLWTSDLWKSVYIYKVVMRYFIYSTTKCFYNMSTVLRAQVPKRHYSSIFYFSTKNLYLSSLCIREKYEIRYPPWLCQKCVKLTVEKLNNTNQFLIC